MGCFVCPPPAHTLDSGMGWLSWLVSSGALLRASLRCLSSSVLCMPLPKYLSYESLRRYGCISFGHCPGAVARRPPRLSVAVIRRGSRSCRHLPPSGCLASLSRVSSAAPEPPPSLAAKARQFQWRTLFIGLTAAAR